MKNLTLLTFVLITSSNLFARSPVRDDPKKVDPQGPKARLESLYNQRNGIMQGLDNLARKVCFSSRFVTAQTLLNKKTKTYNEPMVDRLSQVREEDRALVLPLAIGAERKRSEILDRFIKKSSKPFKKERSNPSLESGDRFARRYYRRMSCLKGRGIQNACILLNKENYTDHLLVRTRKALLSSNPHFFEKYSGSIACSAHAEKLRYEAVLKKVQGAIHEIEKEIKKKGIIDISKKTDKINKIKRQWER